MSFSENFNRICKERKTTPTRLLKSLGFSTSKVAMWNRGSLPKQEMLVLLARELNCTVADFFAEKNEFLPQAKDDDEADLLRIYRSLDRKRKHEFMAEAYRFEEQK